MLKVLKSYARWICASLSLLSGHTVDAVDLLIRDVFLSVNLGSRIMGCNYPRLYFMLTARLERIY